MPIFPVNPNLNISGTSALRGLSNPLERAKELQNAKGKLGTLGFGGDDGDRINEDAADIAIDTVNQFGIDPASANPVRSINDPHRAGPVAAFPDNIGSYENFMKIIILKERIFETTIGTADRAKTTMTPLETIKLPLPSSLATAYAQGYKQEGVGALGFAGAGAAVDLAKNLSNQFKAGDLTAGKLKDELVAGLTQIKDNLGAEGGASVVLGMTDDLSGIIGSALGGGLLGGITGTGVGQIVTAALGQVGLARNPHMAVLYEAPNFRDFNFSWELRPRTPKESDIIRKIIKKLKYYSSPDIRDTDHLFRYPEQFAISFKKDDYLFKTRACVLTNVSIDYHGEGTPLYYDKGAAGNQAPAAVKLDLQFTETRVLRKADINAGM